MLDTFLKVAYDHEKTAAGKEYTVELLKHLPNDYLQALASGEVKLAHLSCGHGEGAYDWLEKFKGSPLFDQALQLEQKTLEMDLQKQQTNNERRQMWDQQDQEMDQLRIQKKLLDLQLVQQEGQAAGGMPAVEGAPPELPPEAASPEVAPPGPAAAANPVSVKVGSAEKIARATAKDRMREGAQGATVGALAAAGDYAFGRHVIGDKINLKTLRNRTAVGALVVGGLAAALAKSRKEKSVANPVSVKVGAAEKKAFSLTSSGHKIDAHRARAKEQYHTQVGKAHRGIVEALGDSPGVMSSTRRHATREVVNRGKARHQAYIAERHEKGRNAYNPVGGHSTPTKDEQKTKKAFALALQKLALNAADYSHIQDTKLPTPKVAPLKPGPLVMKSLAQVKKAGVLGDMAGGVSGAAKFVGNTVRGAGNVGNQAWVKRLSEQAIKDKANTYLKARGNQAVDRVGSFIKKSPGAAAGLAAAGTLGTMAVGRATKSDDSRR